MKHLTKLTSLLVLTVGLAAAPLASAEPGHDDGPHPEQQSPHMKKPVPHPPEARKHKAEHPMKKAPKHAAKKNAETSPSSPRPLIRPQPLH